MKIKDEIFMKRALSLAELGIGKTSPNPMVGCVIVKENKIIGQGWHHEFGKNHAEIEALNDAVRNGNEKNIKGSVLYVTLEPCSHFGKTPPCAERLVREGISKVVIAMKDPNELVNGRGIKILRDSGIEVSESCLEKEAKWLNRGFIRFHKNKRPWVNLKIASSLDGKMALKNGSSKWITGKESRISAHLMRSENDAVLVGIGTILKDNPELTVRHVKGKNPLRVVLDSNLLIPVDSKVIKTEGKCLVLTSENADDEKIKILENSGVEVKKITKDFCTNNLSLKDVLEYLAFEKGILNLMVEGGPKVLNSFIKKKLADYVKIFFAPKILGDGFSFGTGLSFESVSDSVKLKDIKSKKIGEDILIEGRFECSPDL